MPPHKKARCTVCGTCHIHAAGCRMYIHMCMLHESADMLHRRLMCTHIWRQATRAWELWKDGDGEGVRKWGEEKWSSCCSRQLAEPGIRFSHKDY